ncbi:MAG: hypothetical protein V5A57_02730 [Candidatus Paceibacterota bacterium]
MNNKILITLISLVVVIGLVFLFVGNRDNEPANEPSKVEEVGEEKIINYLKNSGLVKANNESEIFADYHEFNRTQDRIFVWAYIVEYSFRNKLKQESGVSLPLVLNVSEGKITAHNQPRDGTHHEEDIRKMFPEELQEDVLNFHTKHKQKLNNLIDSVEEKAKQQLKQETSDYQFPEQLEADYISARDWEVEVIKNEDEYPEKFEVTEQGIACEEKELNTDLPGKIYPEVINGKSYCIETTSEGAAGTTYTEYAYSTLKDNDLVTISFLAEYVNCGVLPESERIECEEERETFEFDQVISEIVDSD